MDAQSPLVSQSDAALSPPQPRLPLGGSNTDAQIATARLILASLTSPHAVSGRCCLKEWLPRYASPSYHPLLLCPPLPALLCSLQVMYSQDKHSRPSVVETNTTSLELSLPVNQDYVIQIKPFSEGGEGSSSRQITIPKIAGGAMQRNWSAEK